MLKLKKLHIKNFMSVGEIEQVVDLTNEDVVLVLGENLDNVTDNQILSRNAVGKTTINFSLSYVLYGQVMGTIKKDNLINNINQKAMAVKLEFEKDGVDYIVERGRKPNFFRFLEKKDGDDEEVDEEQDETQGENKDTQEELERVIGLSHTLFKHLVVFNTNTEPFLDLPAKLQREFIEELLGIKLLSEKAEALKEQMGTTKEDIRVEQTKIKMVTDNNEKINHSVASLTLKKESWEKNHKQSIKDSQSLLEQLREVNVEEEIEAHNHNKTVMEYKKVERELTQSLNRYKQDFDRLTKSIQKNEKELEKALSHTCPTCEQTLDGDSHKDIAKNLKKLITQDTKLLKNAAENEESTLSDLELVKEELASKGAARDTFYERIEDAYNQKTNIELCLSEIANLEKQINPYEEQIKNLEETGVQEVDYTVVNDLAKLKEHQDFLYKLLTSNDSFIRRKVIEQNIMFLNERLTYYLEKLSLPHIVTFKSDLTVDITNFGRDIDFAGLSRGEKTRLILGLSWSFRDIFEMLQHPINLIMIDELLDVGADQQLVDSAVGVIRAMSRERKKNVFLISHRDELVSKIPTVLKVRKEHGFTSLELIENYSG